jgi:hypothetical protein
MTQMVKNGRKTKMGHNMTNIERSQAILFAERRGMDCWLYDELLVLDEDTLSHEILFASGAKLLLHFKNKGISITKLK